MSGNKLKIFLLQSYCHWEMIYEVIHWRLPLCQSDQFLEYKYENQQPRF